MKETGCDNGVNDYNDSITQQTILNHGERTKQYSISIMHAIILFVITNIIHVKTPPQGP